MDNELINVAAKPAEVELALRSIPFLTQNNQVFSDRDDGWVFWQDNDFDGGVDVVFRDRLDTKLPRRVYDALKSGTQYALEFYDNDGLAETRPAVGDAAPTPPTAPGPQGGTPLTPPDAASSA